MFLKSTPQSIWSTALRRCINPVVAESHVRALSTAMNNLEAFEASLSRDLLSEVDHGRTKEPKTVLSDWREQAAKGNAIQLDGLTSSPVSNFSLAGNLSKQLKAAGIEELFPVQAQSFEMLTAGRDVVGKSPTGSGKTLAFALPAVDMLLRDPDNTRGRAPRVLVVAPTRELARQVEKEFVRIGGHVVVATPGRLIDHINRGTVDLSDINVVVLDESDEMLKMGFKDDVEKIMNVLPPPRKIDHGRQMMLWSATVPSWVKHVAKRYMETPVTLDLVGQGSSHRIPQTVQHMAYTSTNDNKINFLNRIIKNHTSPHGRVLVFSNTKMECNELALIKPLHGDLSQNIRERTLKDFRDGRTKVVVATDVAARGIDVPDVELVVHFSMPGQGGDETFVHRTGRTGRMGKDGTNVMLINASEITEANRMGKELDIDIKFPRIPNENEGNEVTMLNHGLRKLINKINELPKLLEEPTYNNNRGGNRGGYGQNRGGNRGGGYGGNRGGGYGRNRGGGYGGNRGGGYGGNRGGGNGGNRGGGYGGNRGGGYGGRNRGNGGRNRGGHRGNQGNLFRW
eukprot:GSMAST32.ASY1.ANO1.310.1 assembled CDS